MVRIKRVFVLPEDVFSRIYAAWAKRSSAKGALDKITEVIGEVNAENIEVVSKYVDAYTEATLAYQAICQEIVLLARQAGHDPTAGDSAVNFTNFLDLGSVYWMRTVPEVELSDDGTLAVKGEITENAENPGRSKDHFRDTVKSIIRLFAEIQAEVEAEEAVDTTEDAEAPTIEVGGAVVAKEANKSVEA